MTSLNKELKRITDSVDVEPIPDQAGHEEVDLPQLPPQPTPQGSDSTPVQEKLLPPIPDSPAANTGSEAVTSPPKPLCPTPAVGAIKPLTTLAAAAVDTNFALQFPPALESSNNSPTPTESSADGEHKKTQRLIPGLPQESKKQKKKRLQRERKERNALKK